MDTDTLSSPGFESLGLPESLLSTLNDLGYAQATPIQALTIPPLLRGGDVVGQAQTGTGKTAAFALPLLSRLDLDVRQPQVLVLTPTRELAIQISEACAGYARGLPGVSILPIFGGQDYGIQIRGLKRGVHMVVGTPGRIMDHMRRGTLDLSALRAVVLDEADEMLHMGFVEDVEWIMGHTPESRQVALFSATMPPRIRGIARQYLSAPTEISLETRSSAAETIEQRYCVVPAKHKDEALLRILELEETDGVIVFARTKSATTELSEVLVRAGHRAAALNGDLAQSQREQTVGRLRKGDLDILVATDVAARGMDVDRISHVINYDPPRNAEAYVHRIGRTGRAGRAGKAILLLHPRDRVTLRHIEQATRQDIRQMPMPSVKRLNEKRTARFAEEIARALRQPSTEAYRAVIAEVIDADGECSPLDVAAALAAMVRGDRPLLLEELPIESFPKRRGTENASPRQARRRPDRSGRPGDANMERYVVWIGANHGMNPGHLVGAIANEADLSGEFIGRIEIHGDHSTVDLPVGMPDETFRRLKRVKVCNRRLRISKAAGPTDAATDRGPRQRHRQAPPFSKKQQRKHPRAPKMKLASAAAR